MIFEDLYDEFERICKEVFEDHQELTDNDLIENNSELQLNLGYGVLWGEATNTERSLDCIMSVNQTVTVTNTIENKGTDQDIEARKKAVRDILNNCYKLVKVIEAMPDLNERAQLVKFSGHPGPQSIFNREGKNYFMIQATYQLEWFRNKGE